jgi:hypothetical protein
MWRQPLVLPLLLTIMLLSGCGHQGAEAFKTALQSKGSTGLAIPILPEVPPLL